MLEFIIFDFFLIKFTVEGNTNFNCIVCKAEFFTRTERNEHLETHFVHKNCEHCNKAVIIIGDLEFELHRPTYCKETEENDPRETVFDATEEHLLYDENNDYERIDSDYLENDIVEIEKPKRSRPAVNYNENIVDDNMQDEPMPGKILNSASKSQRKSKRSAKTRSTRAKCSEIDIKEEQNEFEVEFDADDAVMDQQSESNDEDDVVKQLDVALKKRRKQYAKLPKTIPCTMCDTMFGTERTLKIHMSQVHGIKEKYICPICSREFKLGGNLKQHIETHSDYKRFICNYCGKGFHLPYVSNSNIALLG